MIQLTAGKLWGMRRMAGADGIFKMTAVDQRPPIKTPIAQHLGVEQAPWSEVARFKSLLVETLQSQSTAMLLDPHYAIPNGLDCLSPHKGLVVTLEDSVFKDTPEGRLSSNIDDWSVEKIKRMGGDAVKVLAWYRPDAGPSQLQAQQDYVKRIGAECAQFDIPFLLELLVYPLAGDTHQTQEYIEMQGKKADQVLASVSEFSKPEYAVDLFKLESPVNAVEADGSSVVQDIFDEMGRIAGRPWVMLSAGAGKAEFHNILEHAFKAGASGFLAGRAIWLDAFRSYPAWQQIRRDLEGDAADYLQDIAELAGREAQDWRRHSCYGEQGAVFTPADSSFRHSYQPF